MRIYGPVNAASAWWVFDMGNFSNSWRPYSDQSLSCRSRAKWETCGLRLSSMLMVTQANQQIAQGKWSLLQQLVSVRHRISFKTTLSLVRQLRTNIPGTTSSVMLLRLSICFKFFAWIGPEKASDDYFDRVPPSIQYFQIPRILLFAMIWTTKAQNKVQGLLG